MSSLLDRINGISNPEIIAAGLMKSKGDRSKEGSKGGNVIGHTSSGNPIYAPHNSKPKGHEGYSKEDHLEAAKLHRKKAGESRYKRARASGKKSVYTHRDAQIAHETVADHHSRAAGDHASTFKPATMIDALNHPEGRKLIDDIEDMEASHDGENRHASGLAQAKKRLKEVTGYTWKSLTPGDLMKGKSTAESKAKKSVSLLDTINGISIPEVLADRIQS